MEPQEGLPPPVDYREALFQGMPEACAHCRVIFEGDVPVDGVLLHVNAAFERRSGLTGCEGGRISERVPGILGAAPDLLGVLGRVARGGGAAHFETWVAPLDRWFAVGAHPCGPDELVVVIRDITEELRIKRERTLSEERFRVVAEECPVALFLQRDGRFIYANPAAAQLTRADGPAELIGKLVLDYVHPADRKGVLERLREALATGRVVQAGKERLLRFDGTFVEVAISARAVSFEGQWAILGMAQDITPYRQAQEAEAQARKADSLVLMAGSIAHDFNNLFAAISASLEILQLQSRDRPELLATITTAADVLRRAISLSWKMNDFSGRAVSRLTWIDLSEQVFQWAAAWGAHRGGRRPVLELGEVPRIKGDPARLRRVFDAIAENAWEAMDEAGVEGRVLMTLRMDPAPSEDDELGRWASERPRGPTTVCLEIANDGPFPDPEVLARMFDPFFTTRFVGRGLGLASVLGLLQVHGAGIHVLPGPGGAGMAFRIHFPVPESQDQ